MKGKEKGVSASGRRLLCVLSGISAESCRQEQDLSYDGGNDRSVSHQSPCAPTVVPISAPSFLFSLPLSYLGGSPYLTWRTQLQSNLPADTTATFLNPTVDSLSFLSSEIFTGPPSHAERSLNSSEPS